MSDRYGIGEDAENHELLIEDHKTHKLIARSGQMALEDLRELVRLANLGDRYGSPQDKP